MAELPTTMELLDQNEEEIPHSLRVEFWGGTFSTLIDTFGSAWLFNHDKTHV